MALKYKVKSLEELPAEHANLYVEREGAFVLDAEGVVEKAKADEMRASNIALKKQLEEHTARFEGIEALPKRVQVMPADVQQIKTFITQHCDLK